MSSILIVGINYRPETTGIAPYTSAVAEHLAASGHRVTVVTGFPHYPAWRRAEGERRSRAAEMLNGVRVLRRRHYVPRRQSALKRAIYEGTFAAHALLSRPARADAVIGVAPSLGGAVAARLFARRFRTAYAVIVQDLMGPAARQSGIQGGATAASVTTRLERWGLAGAAAIGIVSEAFRPYIVELGIEQDRLISVPNWTHVDGLSTDPVTVRERFGWQRDETIVLHAGNMGLKQGLEQVVAAAARADERAAPVRFVLMGDGSQREFLEREAAGVGRLQFLPFQPEAEFGRILTAADILLVSERASVVDMSLPSKLTSYFAAGRPVIAATPEDGATAAEVNRSGAGIVVRVGRPDELNEAVAHLAADPDRAAALGEAGRSYAVTSLGAAQALERVDELVRRTLGAARARGGG